MQLRNLIELRKNLGYNQKEFAEQLAIKQTTYNGYENGIRDPGIDFLVMVAIKYNVTTDYLAGITDTPTPASTKKTPPVEDEDNIKAQLIENYDSMNVAGQHELLKHSRLLLNDNQYKKCDQFDLGKGIA